MQSDNKGAMTFGQESIADHYGNTERERHSFSKAIYESAEKGEPIPDLEIEYTNGGTRRMSIHDGVFGDITEHGPNYRNVCAKVLHKMEPQGLMFSRSDGLVPWLL